MAKITQKSIIFVFWRVKLHYKKLVEVWQALSREHLLCYIIPYSTPRLPSFIFGEMIVLSYLTSILQDLCFMNFLLYKTPLIQVERLIQVDHSTGWPLNTGLVEDRHAKWKYCWHFQCYGSSSNEITKLTDFYMLPN